jgi:hypothetical protein
MSNIVKFGGGFLGLCVVGAMFAPAPKDNPASSTALAVNTPSLPPPPPEPVKACQPTQYMAAELKASMERNEAKTAHMWKQARCAMVTGRVLSVGSGFDDKPFVSIGTGQKYEFTGIVHCSPRVASKAFELSKGDIKVFTGTTGGEAMGTLQLNNCDWL